jgi:allantoin racemase
MAASVKQEYPGFSRGECQITVLEQSIPRASEHVLAMGIHPHLLAAVRSVDIPVSNMRDDLDATLERLYTAGMAARQEDRCESLVLGCLGMAGLGTPLSERLGIPVIDPAFAAMAYTSTTYCLTWPWQRRCTVT